MVTKEQTDRCRELLAYQRRMLAMEKSHGGDPECEVDMEADCNALAALIETVEKLPETADGVRVVPGMRVWIKGYSENGEVHSITYDGEILVNDSRTWPNPQFASGDYSVRFPHELLSADESALSKRNDDA